MAPATDSVMGALPLAKASVGSAMNDTARLVGGTLGVAVLGTVVSQVYRDHVAPATAGLPVPVAEPSLDSLQGAIRVAAGLPHDGDTLAAAARVAFTDGMNRAAVVAALVAIAAALVALVLLPAGRRRSNARQPRGHGRGVATS